MPREVTGAVGFGKETTYDTAVSPAHVFYAEQARPDPAVDSFNEAETANGTNWSTGITPMADMTRIRIPSVGHDETLAAFAAAAWGTDAVTTPAGATAARQHKIVPIGVSAELPSYTAQVSLTTNTETTLGKANRYSGCVVDTFQMGSSVRDKPLRCSIEFATSGTTAAGVDLSSASRPNFGPFRHNNVFCFIGTSFTPGSLNLPIYASAAEAPDGAEIGSAVDWSKYIRGYQLTTRANVDQEGGHSGSTGLNATSMFAGRFSGELSLTLRFVDSDSTMLAMVTPGAIASFTRSIGIYGWSPDKIEDVTTDYQYAYSLFVSYARLKGLTWGSANLGIREVTAVFEILSDTTNNPLELYVWNKDATDWA